jgi:hypothetical protein
MNWTWKPLMTLNSATRLKNANKVSNSPNKESFYSNRIFNSAKLTCKKLQSNYLHATNKMLTYKYPSETANQTSLPLKMY